MKIQNAGYQQTFGSIYFKKPTGEVMQNIQQTLDKKKCLLRDEYMGFADGNMSVGSLESKLSYDNSPYSSGYVIQNVKNGYSRIVSNNEGTEDRILLHVQDMVPDAKLVPDHTYTNIYDSMHRYGISVEDISNSIQNGWLSEKKVKQSITKGISDRYENLTAEAAASIKENLITPNDLPEKLRNIFETNT